MRVVGVTIALAMFGLAAPGRSEDIYHWTDAHGVLNYSNAPTDGVAATRVPGVVESVPDPSAAANVGTEAAAGAEALSAQASLRRNALERDLRATERRLRDVDARLAVLGRARNQNARGSEATGGVGTLAVDVRSDEERVLATEREQLAQHAMEIRSDATQLREELSAQLGGTPAWWNDPR